MSRAPPPSPSPPPTPSAASSCTPIPAPWISAGQLMDRPSSTAHSLPLLLRDFHFSPTFTPPRPSQPRHPLPTRSSPHPARSSPHPLPLDPARQPRYPPLSWFDFPWPHRLAWSRTPGSHPGNRGSNPLGVTSGYGTVSHGAVSLCTGALSKTSPLAADDAARASTAPDCAALGATVSRF